LAGGILRRDGDLPGAERELQAAVLAAEAGRADRIKATALVGLVTVYTTWTRPREAHAVADQAKATIARLGGDARETAHLESELRAVFEREHKPAEALAHFTVSLAGYRRLADDFQIARTLEDIAAQEGDLDRHADSEAHYREAHSIVLRLVGAGHPHVATTLAELAEALRRQNKSDESKRTLESGLAIAQAAKAHPES